MIEFHKIFNIKPSHFKDGWTEFDSISREELSQAFNAGCRVLNVDWTTVRILNLVMMNDGVLCLGKISDEGMILLDGIRGFGLTDVCLKSVERISENAKSQKITPEYVYVEW